MDEQPSQPADQPGDFTEEQLRAAYEEQLKRIRVDDVLIQTVVSLINLAGLRLQEKQLEEVHQAIEATRAVLPLVEETLGPDAGQIRQALSQLQLAYAREVGASADAPGPGDAPAPDDSSEGGDPPSQGPGPAQSSGRLWVPGQ